MSAGGWNKGLTKDSSEIIQKMTELNTGKNARKNKQLYSGIDLKIFTKNRKQQIMQAQNYVNMVAVTQQNMYSRQENYVALCHIILAQKNEKILN